MNKRNQKIEFGDFQTPDDLAMEVCQRLKTAGITPDVVIEPTCGVGAFVVSAIEAFPDAKHIFGFDINEAYLDTLRSRLSTMPTADRAQLAVADFFGTDWKERINHLQGSVLVVGNFPWVTNATQGAMGGANLPEKSNFLGFNGFDAISGKANFDISEWMLLEVLRWFSGHAGDIAMLVKTAVARKVLSHAERQKEPVREASLIEIDAKKSFGASVDACLLIIRLDPTAKPNYDYTVYASFDDRRGKRVGHRQGRTVGDLDAFKASSFLVGESPQKWRSGIKHDASGVMELTRKPGGYENGLGKIVELEDDYVFPLLKGSDIGSNKAWREKFVIVTQRFVGEATDSIQERAPKTWAYLVEHAEQLDARVSTIYKKNPRFSIFGVGDYAFRPWRIAICGLYKTLRFRLVPPMSSRPVMFDDTVYFLSFETEEEASDVLQRLESTPATSLLSSLIFWDEKRPIKTSILNSLDWTKLDPQEEPAQALLL